jgi:hypothetical protein
MCAGTNAVQCLPSFIDWPHTKMLGVSDKVQDDAHSARDCFSALLWRGMYTSWSLCACHHFLKVMLFC